MRMVIYILLTLFFILLLVHFIDFRVVIASIMHVQWRYILLSTILGMMTSFATAYRLQMLLGIIKKLPLLFVWGTGNVAGLLSTLLPFSAGGFITSYIVSKKLKSSYSKTLSIFFIDYILSFILSIVLFPIALVFFLNRKLLSITYDDSQIVALFAVLIIISVGILITARQKFFRVVVQKLKKVANLLKSNLSVVVNALLITVVFGLVGAMQSYLYFVAFGLYPGIIDFILASSILTVINLIPGAPMKIGQYETFGVLTLPYLLALDTNKVFAMLLTQRAVSILIIFLQGFISLHILHVDLRFLIQMTKLQANKQREP